MNISKLRTLQFEFEKQRSKIEKELKPIVELRDQFVADYPSRVIEDLELDEYVVGKGQKNTFCYRIETELNSWGNIHGSPAIKFGVYYGHRGEGSKKEYRIGKKAFGDDIKSAFLKVKSEIGSLIKHGELEDYDRLKSNLISPMYKGKILSVYFPEKYLNIYSEAHLNHFIDSLGLLNDSKSELDKQNLLLEYKKSNEIMKKWSTFEFNRFLYNSFGTPNSEINQKKINPALQEFKTRDFPPIEQVVPQEVDLSLLRISEKEGHKNPKRSRKIDYVKRNIRNSKIGERGELAVIKFEKQKLNAYGKPELVNKIQRVSEFDDSIGFDILSYDEFGKEIYIEVKSTVNSFGSSKFYITRNELEKSKNMDDFYIYFVYEVDSRSPSIWIKPAKELWDSKYVFLEPNSYQVVFKTVEE